MDVGRGVAPALEEELVGVLVVVAAVLVEPGFPVKVDAEGFLAPIAGVAGVVLPVPVGGR